jgi:hypothetical protein
MQERYIIKIDIENEQFKILDTQSKCGTEDQDDEWVATTYDIGYAQLLCRLLNERKPGD